MFRALTFSVLLVVLPFPSFQVDQKKVDGTSQKAGPPAPPPGDAKIFGNNPDLVTGLAVGAGAGLVGSLVVGALLDQKKKHKHCHYRQKRDGTGNARFLPIGPGCPPPPHGYQPPSPSYNGGGYQPYQPQNVGGGYQPYQPQNAYNHPAPVNAYNPPINSYKPQPPVNVYNPPQQVNGYGPQAPVHIHHLPQGPVYNPPAPLTSYNPPSQANSYNPAVTSYQPASSGYQAPARTASGSGGFSQTDSVIPTAAAFKFGVGK